jgi:hypothetical protein
VTMRRLLSVVLALVAALPSACATGEAVSARGRNVEITPRAEVEPRSKVQGELLAVDAGKIWVLGKERVVTVPIDAVQEVKVQRHSMTASRVALWSVLGTLVAGSALAIACSSVEGNNDCGKVFLAVGATFAVIGGIAAPTLGSSSATRLPQPRAENLQPFARFPQGLPEGVDTATLRGPR